MTKSRILSKILYWLRWLIPLGLFYLIFREIDWVVFIASLTQTNLWWLILGLCMSPLMILVGALRWHFLLTRYGGNPVRISFSLNHYWTGLALGFFLPSSIGWDAYRVMVAGRRFDHYDSNVIIIIVEKIASLIIISLMIVTLYPLVSMNTSPAIERVLSTAYRVFLVITMLLIAVNVGFRNRAIGAWFKRIEEAIISRLPTQNRLKTNGFSIKAAFSPFTTPKLILPVLFLSFGIQLLPAIGGQFYFRALDYPVPFLVNLFVTPVLFFIFLLPISFGGLGLREGGFIILYGLFDVPPETALLVSFFSLTGILLNNLIGGVVILAGNLRKKAASPILPERFGEN